MIVHCLNMNLEARVIPNAALTWKWATPARWQMWSTSWSSLKLCEHLKYLTFTSSKGLMLFIFEIKSTFEYLNAFKAMSKRTFCIHFYHLAVFAWTAEGCKIKVGIICSRRKAVLWLRQTIPPASALYKQASPTFTYALGENHVKVQKGLPRC